MNSEEYDHISHYLSDNVYPQSILQLKNCRHVKKTFRVKASQYQLGENDKIFKVISNSILNCMYITHNTVEHYGHFVLLTVPGNVKLIKLVSEPTLPYPRIVAPPPHNPPPQVSNTICYLCPESRTLSNTGFF